MKSDSWLPIGHSLVNGSKIRALEYSADNWQIYEISEDSKLLVANADLAKKWCDSGFLTEPMLSEIEYGVDTYRTLHCSRKHDLRPVYLSENFQNKTDSLAFASALKVSRKLSEDASFHDAIYVEQYSRLLPTWTLSNHVEDEVVLGTWITGGVEISTDSFRRLVKLTGWISSVDIAEIIEAAGLQVSVDPHSLAKTKSRRKIDNQTVLDVDVKEENDSKSSLAFLSLRNERFLLPGRAHLEEFFNEYVIDIIFNSEKYKTLGIDFPSAIVLHGPPGCGKTFAVEKLIEFIDWPSYSVDSSSVSSPYIHDTSKKISEVFSKAISDSPSVIIIDEMESYLSDRQSAGAYGQHHVEEVAEFLRRIPEAINNSVLIIAMTNMIERIDPAILRRGRFDHIIEVGMPSKVEVESLINALLSKVPTAKGLNLDSILDVLTGKALSDSAFVVREAARLAAKSGKVEIDQLSIDAALQSLPAVKEDKPRLIGFTSE